MLPFVGGSPRAVVEQPLEVIDRDPDTVLAPDSPSSRASASSRCRAWGTRAVLIIDAQRGTVTAHRSPAAVAAHTGEERVDLADVVDGWTPTVAELLGR